MTSEAERTIDSQAPTSRSRTGNALRPARVIFFAALAFWIVYPIVIAGDPAQDTVPYVVAGELAAPHPGAIYPEKSAVTDLTPEFRRRSCDLLGSAALCARAAGPFVSPPSALPLAVALSWSGNGATRLVRLVAMLCLVSGMAIAWKSLTAQNRAAEAPLALAAVCLTPLMFRPIDLGQTSPLLFLAVVLPLATRDRKRGEIAIGVALGAAIAIKAFPAAMLVVPLASRRVRQLVTTAGVLGVCSAAALLMAGSRIWREYIRVSGDFTRYAQHDLNGGSIDAALGQLGVGSSALATVARVLLFAAVLALARRRSYLARWALGWAGLLVLLPHALNHYLFAGVGAVLVAAVAGAVPEGRTWVVAGAAVATLPVALINPGGSGFPVLLFLTNLALLIVVVVLTHDSHAAEVPG